MDMIPYLTLIQEFAPLAELTDPILLDGVEFKNKEGGVCFYHAQDTDEGPIFGISLEYDFDFDFVGTLDEAITELKKLTDVTSEVQHA